MAPNLGSTITIEAKVLHVVDLGGGETNYCLEMPSGRQAWILGSQLGVEAQTEGDDGTKAQPEAPGTKHVPGPPTKKAPRRATVQKRAPAA